MLTEKISMDFLKNSLVKGGKFKPFSKACERNFWGNLDKNTTELLVKAGEDFLGRTWPILPAVRYMDFHRNGNRTEYENVCFERRAALANLVLAECAEYKGRFIDDIIDLIWCICEETTWCIPAHKFLALTDPDNALRSPDEAVIDLFASEAAATLAFTYYLLHDELYRQSSFITKRIEDEIEKRILKNYMERNDYWWMSFESYEKHGINNWNPWVNSNCIACFLIFEKNIYRLTEAIYKAIRSIDLFIGSYYDDGGCDEGPGYWSRAGASLFDCLELLYQATGGIIDFYGNEKIRQMGRYIYKVFIDNDNFLDFADCPPVVVPDSVLVYRFGKRIGDGTMMSFAKSIYERKLSGKINKDTAMYRRLWGIETESSIKAYIPEKSPYVRDVWMEGIQVAGARQHEGSSKGFYLAAKGGHNAESHNHNDIGHFIVYYNGKPVIIDMGVEEYSKKTFSDKRYEIWTMQSSYHSLPEINGFQQKPGLKFSAENVNYQVKDENVNFDLSIKNAYPGEAMIDCWQRLISFDREAGIIKICDKFKLREIKKNTVFNFMSSGKPLELSPGKLEFSVEDEKVIMEYSMLDAKYICEEYAVESRRLAASWGDKLYRIRLEINNTPLEGRFEVKFYKG